MTKRELMEMVKRFDDNDEIIFVTKNFKEMTKTKQMEKIMHGYWIYHPDWQADGECGYECSECERGVDLNYTYCPHCGAKMDGVMKIIR